MQLNPGDRLKNGAIVLEHYDMGDKSKVLALVPDTHQPFVYWTINAEGDTFWGHYFSDLATAVCEFEVSSWFNCG